MEKRQKVVGKWKQEYGDHIRWLDSLSSRENPATGYDHRISASTFPPETRRTLSPRLFFVHCDTIVLYLL